MTEKNYNPKQKEKKAMKKQEKIGNKKIAETKKEEKKKETKTEEKKDKKQVQKVKKEEAIARGVNLPISTKYAIAICRFINKKPIEKAIVDLEEVLKFKKVIPMKGEIPHKKGKGVMSGRYPIKTIGYFIRMLKDLAANVSVNGLEEPIITEAIANKASRPYGRFGAVKRKRTHVKIIAREKSKMEKKK